MWHVYLLLCADNSIYCGATNNIVKRLKTHNIGKGAKYTASRLPVTLVYLENFESKNDALKREWFIKHKMSRKEKNYLIRNYNE